MNRKEFFKKLGIGVAAMIVAPQLLVKVSKDNYCEGLVPYLRRTQEPTDQAWCKMWAERVYQQWKTEGSLIEQIKPHLDSINKSWLKMQVALDKERKRVIRDLITYGRAETNLL